MKELKAIYKATKSEFDKVLKQESEMSAKRQKHVSRIEALEMDISKAERERLDVIDRFAQDNATETDIDLVTTKIETLKARKESFIEALKAIDRDKDTVLQIKTEMEKNLNSAYARVTQKIVDSFLQELETPLLEAYAVHRAAHSKRGFYSAGFTDFLRLLDQKIPGPLRQDNIVKARGNELLEKFLN